MKIVKYISAALIVLSIVLSAETANSQVVSLKYKPDYITGVANTGVIRVIMPKASNKKFQRKKNDNNENGNENVVASGGTAEEKSRVKKDNGDGTVTEVITYTDGSEVEETTLVNGTTRKTTTSPDGTTRNTIETSTNGNVTEINSTVEEMQKTIKITTTVVTRDSGGIILAETTKEKIIDK